MKSTDSIIKGFKKTAMNVGLLNPAGALKGAGRKALALVKKKPVTAMGAGAASGAAIGRMTAPKDNK